MHSEDQCQWVHISAKFSLKMLPHSFIQHILANQGFLNVMSDSLDSVHKHIPCFQNHLMLFGNFLAFFTLLCNCYLQILKPRTTRFNILKNSTLCPHIVFMCFVWISEQTAIIALYSINFWHRSFTINSNKSPTWYNNFSVYYLDVCLQLNMSRAFSRPSSGAQWLQWQPLVLPSYRGDSRAVFEHSTTITTIRR